jgi:hypothetical protein
MGASIGKGNGKRQGRLVRSDIFQIFAGLVLAVALFQSDRVISAASAAGTPPHALVSTDAMTAGAHMVQLECVRLVDALNRVVRVTASDANACHFMAIFE